MHIHVGDSMLQIDNSRYLYNVRTCVCVYLHRHHNFHLAVLIMIKNKHMTLFTKDYPCVCLYCAQSQVQVIVRCGQYSSVVPDIHASLYRLSCNSHNPTHPTLFQIYRSAPDSVQLFLVVVIEFMYTASACPQHRFEN